MHGSDDAAAHVVVEKRAIGVASGRDTPQRFHAAGVHFGVADVFWLLRRQVHRFDDVSDSGQVELGVPGPGAQIGVEVRELHCLLACHGAASRILKYRSLYIGRYPTLTM